MKRALWLSALCAALIFSAALLFLCPAQPYDLDAQRIRQDTLHLTQAIGIRTAGSPQERQTCDWLASELLSLGLSYQDGSLLRTAFSCPDGSVSENLTAVFSPSDSAPLFTIMAHYDSVASSPGARDNAASVACLLEIARYLSLHPEEFSCEIRLVFLGAEETGYHGSRAYVSALSPQELERHMGAFNLDISAASSQEGAQLVCNTLGGMVEGTYQEGNFLAPVDNRLSAAVSSACSTLYKWSAPVFHMGESDHISFHQLQLEAINVCWRRVENGFPVLPDSYHQPSDTPDELDYEGTIRASGRCILAAIQQLAER